MPLRVAMTKRTRGDHLGVEQGIAAEQAVEVTAVTVSPIHHRRNTSPPHAKWLIYIIFFFWQVLHLGRFLHEVHTNCTRSEHKEHNGLINYYTQIAHIGNILAANYQQESPTGLSKLGLSLWRTSKGV
jgi:hypothetical protein